MNWNGVLGTVANVIGSALPFVLGLAESPSRSGGRVDQPQAIGPATLFQRGGTLELGNFYSIPSAQVGATTAPVLVTFSTAEGDPNPSSLTVKLDFGYSFDATPWLQQYNVGNVTVGLAEPADTRSRDGVLDGLWTFMTRTILSVERTITAIVNPQLTLTLRLEPNNNCVLISAVGAVALLGTTYLLSAKNNAGQDGTRSGPLEPVDDPRDDGSTEFQMALPTGVDYDDGVYELSLQLPLQLSEGNYASVQSVHFTAIPQAARDAILARMR